LFHSDLIEPRTKFAPHHNNDAAGELYNQSEWCDALEYKQAHCLERSANQYGSFLCFGSRTPEFIGGYAIRQPSNSRQSIGKLGVHK